MKNTGEGLALGWHRNDDLFINGREGTSENPVRRNLLGEPAADVLAGKKGSERQLSGGGCGTRCVYQDCGKYGYSGAAEWTAGKAVCACCC